MYGRKNPTAPETGAVAAGGLGVTPPDTAKQYTYVKRFRWTGMGGVDYWIAYCPTCEEIVPPVSSRRSRRGTHGEDYWVHEHQLVFIKLWSSNSGRRAVSADEGVLEELKEQAEFLWCILRFPPDLVKKELRTLLSGEGGGIDER